MAKLQITRNDVIRNFRKKILYVGQRYRRIEDLKPGEPGLLSNLDFAKGERLEPTVKNVSKIV